MNDIALVIVRNYQGDVLVIQHQNRLFTLPGGKLEQGECSRAAAIRELAEETGIKTRREFIQYVTSRDFNYGGKASGCVCYAMPIDDYTFTNVEPEKHRKIVYMPPNELLKHIALGESFEALKYLALSDSFLSTLKAPTRLIT